MRPSKFEDRWDKVLGCETMMYFQAFFPARIQVD